MDGCFNDGHSCLYVVSYSLFVLDSFRIWTHHDIVSGCFLLLHLHFSDKYFGFLNAIGFFVILGIGADDVFVFVDAWKQSLHDGGEKSIDARMRRTSCHSLSHIPENYVTNVQIQVRMLVPQRLC